MLAQLLRLRNHAGLIQFLEESRREKPVNNKPTVAVARPRPRSLSQTRPYRRLQAPVSTVEANSVLRNTPSKTVHKLPLNLTMPSQRPFFLSTFFASFRQNPPTSLSQQPNKHTTQTTPSGSASAYAGQQPSATTGSSPRTISSSAHTSSHHHSTSSHTSTSTSNTRSQTGHGSVVNHIPIHSPRTSGHGVPIPGSSPGGRRRGSDSSSEGFRDVLGAEKWYVGGRTAGGEERFFKLGVVRRVRSNDGLSLDRLSL